MTLSKKFLSNSNHIASFFPLRERISCSIVHTKRHYSEDSSSPLGPRPLPFSSAIATVTTTEGMFTALPPSSSSSSTNGPWCPSISCCCCCCCSRRCCSGSLAVGTQSTESPCLVTVEIFFFFASLALARNSALSGASRSPYTTTRKWMNRPESSSKKYIGNYVFC